MDVRLPDGTVIKGVPDGMSKADLTAKLARNGYDISKLGAPAQAQPRYMSKVDPVFAQQQDARNRAAVAEPVNNDTVLGRLAGAAEPLLTLGTGMVGQIAGNLYGMGVTSTGGKFGTPEGTQEGQRAAQGVAQAMTYQPRTDTGRAATQSLGNLAAPLEGLQGIAGAQGLQMMRTAGANAGVVANMAKSTQAAGKLRNMVGTGASAIDDSASAGLAKLSSIGKAMVPKIDPTTAKLAAQAQKFDIPLRPDMLYGNKIAKMLGEASEKVPLSGAKGQARQDAFNRAIINTIGGEEGATKLTPDVFDKAIRQSGQRIGDIAARSPLPVDAKLTGALQSHLENAMKFETSDVQRVIASYIDELNKKAVDGIVPGEAVRKLNTKMTAQMRSTSNGDLKNALGGLQDDIQDAVQMTLSGDDLAALRAARTQYAIAKNIEPLVAKSSTGDISPAGLMGRMTSNNAGKSRMARGNGGDIGELARIGQRFINEPNSSGTAERGLAYGLAGGGALAQPAVTAGVYGAANLYNRTGSSISNSLINRSLRDLAGDGQ